MTVTRSLVAACIFAGAALPAGAQSKPPLKQPLSVTAADSSRFLTLGRTYTRWFLAGTHDSLAAATEDPTLVRMGGLAGIESLRARVTRQFGTQLRMVEEKLTRRDGRLQFWHAATFSGLRNDQMVIRWVLNPQGRIVGAGFGPRSQAQAD